jgi:pyruvate,water dikinase
MVSGFVVGTDVLKTVWRSIEWTDPLFADLPNASIRLQIKDARQLQAVAQHIRQAIAHAPLPLVTLQALQASTGLLASSNVLIRPSLTIYTGDVRNSSQLESGFEPEGWTGVFREVICANEDGAIAAGIKSIWADLFSAQSLFYWQKLGISLQQIHLAVLVQPVLAATAAGKAWANQVSSTIEAVPGLGLPIDRGEVLPDTYQVDIATGSMQAQHLGWKTVYYRLPEQPACLLPSTQVDLSAKVPTLIAQELQPWPLALADQTQYTLNAAQVMTLAHLGKALSETLDSPVEIEWAWLQTDDISNFWLTHVAARSNQPHQSQPTQTITSHSTNLLVTGLPTASGQAIAPAVVLTSQTPQLSFPPGTILVTNTLPTEHLFLLRHAAALVTEQGSPTSHAAILARELGIPAITAATNATQHIQSGTLIWVDGNQGTVHQANPSLALEHPSPLAPSTSAVDSAQIKTQLMVNLSQPEKLAQVRLQAIDGIGLLRSELLAMGILDGLPLHQWLTPSRKPDFIAGMASALEQFAATMGTRPVYYRSLDLASATNSHTTGRSALRGTHRYLVDPDLFDVQLAVLQRVRQAGYTNVHLILPFVRSPEEVEYCRQRMANLGLLESAPMQVWIMAEVPSVLFVLPELVAAGAEGIAIGSNDLTQLLLGVDRDYLAVTPYDERHPAVQRAIAQLIAQAQALGISCSICGQAPVNHPELVNQFVRWGINTISVELDAVESTYQAILQAEQLPEG